MNKKIKDYNENKYNIAWLRQKLQEVIKNLNYFDDDNEVRIVTNTYFVGPNFISIGSLGFIDLDNPTKEEEEWEDSISKEESIYQVLVMHQDYSETLHSIPAKSIKQLEYKIGKIDPYYIDYTIVSKPELVKDGMDELEMALKMEKDTIAQYQNFSKKAGEGDNAEKQLWKHLIKEEEEHVRELEMALKGDYSKIIHDSTTEVFQQSVDGVAKLLRKAKLQENVSFAEGDQSFKTVLVETPNDKFDDVLKTLKEEYEIDSHNGKNRIYVKIKDAVKITLVSPEKVAKQQEIDRIFTEKIDDILLDGGLSHLDYEILNEGIDFYVDFGNKENKAIKAYQLLKKNLFGVRCNLVDDEGFFYIDVVRG